MATVVRPAVTPDIDYPCSDGRPVGETPFHVKNLLNLVFNLDTWFSKDPSVYVAGNMFVYYVQGDRHKHLSPDVFVVRGVAKVPGYRRPHFDFLPDQVVFAKTLASGARIRVHLRASIFKPSV